MPRRLWLAFAVILLSAASAAAQQTAAAQEDYKPKVGQAGKDAVWVPTSPALVEKMLDLAKVTASDFVMDLGSGDGRNVIAAAKRGARGRGVEFNPDLVALSNRIAKSEGVADKASFVQGDMYTADISEATVLALFLLPQNLDKLTSKFLAMKPGSRIVANTFAMTGWEPDAIEELQNDCVTWCKALLWIVPAPVEGTWKLAGGELKLQQLFQRVTGTLAIDGASHTIANGRVHADLLTFEVDGARYEGHVRGDSIAGDVSKSGRKETFKARRAARGSDRL